MFTGIVEELGTIVAVEHQGDALRLTIRAARVLEDAGLVVSRKQGREKLHHLNPVPIRLVHDRWVSKYTQGWVAGLVDLKHALEASMEKVFEIYIRTTPERLWEAITTSEIRSKYHFGAHIDSDWTPGSRFAFLDDPDGNGWAVQEYKRG